MSRLTVLCFAGTYSLALLCDLARFVVRGPARWYATVGLMALGWLVHTTFLANLALQHHELLPVTGLRDSLLLLAWVLAAICLYLVARSPKSSAVGVFGLILVLAVLAVAAGAPRTGWAGFGGGRLAFWGMTHGILLLIGAVCTCVAFLAGLMYLGQARRLKHKKPPTRGFILPSLEQSERWNRWAITVAFPFLTFGILIGLALIVAMQNSGGKVLGWTDPKVLSTAALWIVFALLLHARYRPEWRGKRVMLLTVVAFGFLAFALVGVGLILPTAHGTGMVESGRAP